MYLLECFINTYNVIFETHSLFNNLTTALGKITENIIINIIIYYVTNH